MSEALDRGDTLAHLQSLTIEELQADLYSCSGLVKEMKFQIKGYIKLQKMIELELSHRIHPVKMIENESDVR